MKIKQRKRTVVIKNFA